MARLDQLLASLGYCSRRHARDFLKDHAVTLTGAPGVTATSAGEALPAAGNPHRPGKVPGALRDPSEKVEPARVLVDGEPLDHPEGLLLLLHKPLGLVCSHEEREGPSVYDLLPERWRARNPLITSIGRLDKDTSGLLLLTDRTELVHRLTSPRHKVSKTYEATLDRDVPAEQQAAMVALFEAGTLVLHGEDAPCAPATLSWSGAWQASLVLTEGKYHQVRRMFSSQGAEVVTLHRSRFGELELGDLPAGRWRELPLDTFG